MHIRQRGLAHDTPKMHRSAQILPLHNAAAQHEPRAHRQYPDTRDARNATETPAAHASPRPVDRKVIPTPEEVVSPVGCRECSSHSTNRERAVFTFEGTSNECDIELTHGIQCHQLRAPGRRAPMRAGLDCPAIETLEYDQLPAPRIIDMLACKPRCLEGTHSRDAPHAPACRAQRELRREL